MIAHVRDMFKPAGTYYARGLAMMRASGDGHRTAHSLVHVGKVARERGDLENAARLLADALRTMVEFTDTWMITIAVGQLACVATARGDAEEGARLFAAGKAVQRALAMRQAPHWGRELERWTGVAHAALNEVTFAAAWSAGEAMPLDQAVVLALRIAEGGSGAAAVN